MTILQSILTDVGLLPYKCVLYVKVLRIHTAIVMGLPLLSFVLYILRYLAQMFAPLNYYMQTILVH